MISRTAARTAVKDSRASLESRQETPASVMAAVSSLDKAAQMGAVHPRNAARRKGVGLMKRLSAMGLLPQARKVKSSPAVVEAKEQKPVKVEKYPTPRPSPRRNPPPGSRLRRSRRPKRPPPRSKPIRFCLRSGSLVLPLFCFRRVPPFGFIVHSSSLSQSSSFLAVGHSSLVPDYCSLVTDYCSLVTG